MLGEIMKEFRGRVRLVYKDFPLPFHAGARPAAEASRCAGAQGSYWQYHDLLFLGQPAFSRQDLIGYAGRLGLKADAFTACLESGRFGQSVEADVREGQAAGVRGTPTFFVNGRMLQGYHPLEAFREAVNQALLGAGPRRP